ncbi:MAG: ABC transporter permease subunit [Planctomycetota bacterium]
MPRWLLLPTLPLRTATNPILHRELRVAGRRRGTYISRGAFAFVLALAVVLTILIADQSMSSAATITRMRQLASVAQAVTFAILWIAFLTLCLLGPTLTSGAISEERRARTLPTLATTPITAGQIVLGKLLARMHEALVLLFIAAPVLLSLRVFSGVPWVTVIAFVVVSAASALFGACLGLLYSTWHRGSSGAAVFAWLTAALAFIAPPMIVGIGMSNGMYGLQQLGVAQPVLDAALAAGMVVSPPIVLLAETAGAPPPVTIGWIPLWLQDHPWVVTTVWLVLLSALLTWSAAWSLRRRLASDLNDAPTPKAQPREGESRRLRRLGDHPVRWRESTKPLFPKLWHKLIITIALAIGVGYAYLEFGLDEQPVHMLFGMVALILIVLLASVAATPVVTTEREAQTWQVLLTTPLSAHSILAGKLAGARGRLGWLVALIGLHFAFASLLRHTQWPLLPIVVLIIAGPAAFYLALGLLLSLLCRKSIVASVCAVLTLMMCWVGVPVGIGILHEIVAGPGESPGAIISGLFASHPIVLMSTAINGYAPDAWSLRADPDFRLIDWDLTAGQFFLVVALRAVVHVVGAVLLFLLATRLFSRFGGRSS